ncbi:MAG: hypothetical protein WAV95_18110 [Azonexus sp.]
MFILPAGFLDGADAGILVPGVIVCGADALYGEPHVIPHGHLSGVE